MSHFCVYVITDGKPDAGTLRATLQPWHEYECTGTQDQYVTETDVTDEVTKDYEQQDKAEYPTISAFYKEYYGAEDGDHYRYERDGRFYRKTNPNAKWDWWMVGGRYTGALKPGYDPDNDPANKKTCNLCAGTGKRTDMEVANGCNGCGGTGISVKWPTQWAKIDADSISAKDVPLVELRAVAAQEAAALYDKVHAVIAGRPVKRWDKTRDKHGDGNADAAREEYHNDPVNKDLAAAQVLGFWSTVDDFDMPRADYIKAAEDRAGVPFAVVKDGQWYERGEMGWWGIVSNEKDRDEWNAKFHEMMAGLPETAWITVVDAHI